MNPSRDSLTRLASSYGIVDTELDAFSSAFAGIQPHPQTPRAYCLEAAMEREKPRRFGALEVLLDDWTNPQSPVPIAVIVYAEGEERCVTGANTDAIANGLLSALRTLTPEVNTLVVWNGQGVVFHAFLRHLAVHLAMKGCVLQPLVSGTDVKAIIVRHDHRQWILTDSGVMSGLSKAGQEAFCDAFGASYLSGYSNAQRLSKAIGSFQDTLLSITGVALRPTIAAASLKAMRYHLPLGTRWYRPNLPLESVCRYGGAYRGGYVYYEQYRGPAWRIDVNKTYTSLLRAKLPASCSLTHAGQYLREKPGIFLCRIEGEGHFPAYISSFTLADRRFHKQYTSRPAFWTWLPSAEFVGLRAIGYKIDAGLGFQFDTWVSLSGFAEQLIHHITSPKSPQSVVLVAKMLGNSLTGKLGESPEHLNVCYSIGEPRGDWVPFATVEREVIPHLWVQKHRDFKGGQHVDAAAWVTAMCRGKVYGQLARIQGLGLRAVHVDTDGIIMDGDPRPILPLHPNRPGEWRYDGFDPDCLVSKAKWYSFQGEQHTAGLSNVTREQLEAVHYGKRVVIGRKVLGNPFTDQTAYRQADYHLGG